MRRRSGLNAKKPSQGMGFRYGAKETRTPDPLHAIKAFWIGKTVAIKGIWSKCFSCAAQNDAQICPSMPELPFFSIHWVLTTGEVGNFVEHSAGEPSLWHLDPSQGCEYQIY